MTVGKWIMLTKKIPVKPSPPKLSIFYAVPWEINVERLKRQWFMSKHPRTIPELYGKAYKDEMANVSVAGMIKDLKGIDDVNTIFGSEPTDTTAMAILYKGKRIKVWGYEYVDMKPENWEVYYPEVYELVPDTEAEK